MQRLLNGKGFRMIEKKDNIEQEDDEIIESLLDTKLRQHTPFPIQGGEMYPNLDGIEESEHGKNASLSSLKIDDIYVMGEAAIGKDISKTKNHAENIDKADSMAINASKHESKKKKDGSKKLSDKEIERIMEAFKEKLISERMEDEIEENEPQKDDTKNSNVKNYKSKRTTNGKKLKEGGKGDDSGDNSSSDEDDDDSGSKGTPLNNGKGKDKTNSDKGKKKEKNDEDRERNGKKDTPGEKNKDNTGRRDDSDGDGEKDDSGDEENSKRPKARDNKSEVDDTILTNIQNQIDNLSMDLNDIKDRIEKELELDINKSKDSNQKYKEREHMIASVDIQYNKLNSELRNLISKYKDKSLRDLQSQSNDINTTIRETKNLLKNLRSELKKKENESC